jgi:hypothetical protein
MSVCDGHGFWSATDGRGYFSAFSAVARLGAGLLALLVLLIPASATCAQEQAGSANRQFVQAMQLIQQADASLDVAEEARLLRDAERLLNDVIQRYPESQIAVQLITNQFIGDFDVFEFRNRVKALICNEPQSTACFLYRVENLLSPMEYPIATPRWDWLSLAVAYHVTGRSEQAKEIIAPFVSALRRGAARTEGTEQDLFVARALALTGQIDLALQITSGIADCSTRVYNLTDIAEIALWRGDNELAATLTAEAQKYAQDNACNWELGLIVQSLLHIGREAEARTLFLNTVEQQFSRFRETRQECCPAELAVAAADLSEFNLALGLLRTVQDDSPWTIPAVLGRMAAHGETALTGAYLEQVEEAEVQAEILSEFVAAALKRGDPAVAQQWLQRLLKLSEVPANRRPKILIQLAKAERLMFNNERWRTTFLEAILTADRSSPYVRRDIGAPLLAALVRIETGLPMLD